MERDGVTPPSEVCRRQREIKRGLGKTERDDPIVFDVSFPLKPERTAAPVFVGDFAHGSPKERFL
jgi:hypothetical protein